MIELKQIYNNYLQKNNIKKSKVRDFILETFLQLNKHITIYELFTLIKSKKPQIGIATVYRSMKIFSDSKIAEEIDIGDGAKRYEPNFTKKHHDHLICIKCGKIIEVYNAKIEELQLKMCLQHNFNPINHKLQIFGICSECKNI